MRGNDVGLERTRRAAAMIACVLFVSGLVMAVRAGPMAAMEDAPPESPESSLMSVYAARPGRGGARPAGLPRSIPVRLQIPAIKIDTSLMQLGLNADGAMVMPPVTRTAPAGWYRHSATPGEIGTAVIVGHVDSARFGPAVFFRLRRVRPGDAVFVRRADGVTAVFTVVATRRYAKTKFPAEAVYQPAGHAALRLITCGGTFDRMRGRYGDVVVVYAAAQS